MDSKRSESIHTVKSKATGAYSTNGLGLPIEVLQISLRGDLSGSTTSKEGVETLSRGALCLTSRVR